MYRLETIELKALASLLFNDYIDYERLYKDYLFSNEKSIDNVEDLIDNDSYGNMIDDIKNRLFRLLLAHSKTHKILQEDEKEHAMSLIIRGTFLIYPDKYKEWEDVVNKSVNSFLCGKDVRFALEIMERIRSGEKTYDLSREFEELGLSDSFSFIVRKLVLDFCPGGADFYVRTSKDNQFVALSEHPYYKKMNEVGKEYNNNHGFNPINNIDIRQDQIDVIKLISGILYKDSNIRAAYVNAYYDPKLNKNKVKLTFVIDTAWDWMQKVKKNQFCWTYEKDTKDVIVKINNVVDEYKDVLSNLDIEVDTKEPHDSYHSKGLGVYDRRHIDGIDIKHSCFVFDKNHKIDDEIKKVISSKVASCYNYEYIGNIYNYNITNSEEVALHGRVRKNKKAIEE